MTVDDDARDWLARAASDIENPPHEIVTFPAWKTRGGKAHLHERCIPATSSRTLNRENRRPVDCPKCLRSMLADGHVAFRAANRVLWLLDERSARGADSGDRLSDAASRRLTVKVADELRAVATPDDEVLCGVIAALDANRCIDAAATAAWRTKLSVLAAMWSYPSRCSQAVRVENLDLPGTFLPPGLILRETDQAIESSHLLDSICDAMSAGATYDEAVGRADWSPRVYQCLAHRVAYNVDEVPDVFAYRREDYPSSSEWLDAECHNAQSVKVAKSIVWMRDLLRANGPGRERMWVTVTVPKAPPGVYTNWVEYLAWFDNVELRGKRYAQIPLTVLAMLTRVTRTTIEVWQPKAADPLAQATLDTLVALSGDLTGGALLAAYDTACAVTGASPDVVYGTPDLTVRTAVRKPRGRTPEKATSKGQEALPV